MEVAHPLIQKYLGQLIHIVLSIFALNFVNVLF